VAHRLSRPAACGIFLDNDRIGGVSCIGRQILLLHFLNLFIYFFKFIYFLIGGKLLFNFVWVSGRQILNHWTIREDPANVGFLGGPQGHTFWRVLPVLGTPVLNL